MIIAQRKMCRESRKVFELLDEFATKNGVQGITTPAHILICDMLVCKFFTEPMKNVIKNKMAHIGNKSAKHFEITYWDTIITMMLSDKSAMRSTTVPSQIQSESWNIINDLMITDYSIDDCMMMIHISNEYMADQIRRACDIAKNSCVYNISYVNAVLERAKAEQDIKITKIDGLSMRIDKSDHLLNGEIIRHSPVDLAIAEYEFKRKLDGYKLEKKMMLLEANNEEIYYRDKQ